MNNNSLHKEKFNNLKTKAAPSSQLFDPPGLFEGQKLQLDFVTAENNFVVLLIEQQITNYASINSKREHPPRGNFLRWSKALPRGKIFLQKHGPRGKETPTLGEYFRRSGQLFLLIGVEILGFCRNQTWKRIGRLSKYSLVIPSSFSLSTILKILKFSPSFETDLLESVNRW